MKLKVVDAFADANSAYITVICWNIFICCSRLRIHLFLASGNIIFLLISRSFMLADQANKNNKVVFLVIYLREEMPSPAL